MSFVDQIISNARSAAGTVHVTSALNPLLWLCAIVSLPATVLAFLARSDPFFSCLMLILAGLPVIGAISAYVYFMLKAPDRLQSEDYQIRHEALQIIQNKGSDVSVLPTSISAISNPSASLPNDGAE